MIISFQNESPNIVSISRHSVLILLIAVLHSAYLNFQNVIKHQLRLMFIHLCTIKQHHILYVTTHSARANDRIIATDLSLKWQQTTLCLFFYFYLLKKIRFDISCKSSARQRIQKKHQVLFSLKNNEKVLYYECRLLQS